MKDTDMDKLVNVMIDVANEVKLLRKDMDRRFGAMDKRFETMDKRFETMDKRFEAMDKRFERMEKQQVRTNLALMELQPRS